MGANSGIGEAVAHQLAKQPDHHVVIAARNLEASAEVVADLVATGHSTSSVQLVLSSDKSIAKTAQHIRFIHGKLDVPVNNAGGGVDQVPGLTTREIFTQESELNVTGPAILTDAFLLLLTNSAAPQVVFVSSSLASIGMSCDKVSPLYNPGYMAKGYGSIKAALNGLVSHYSQLLTDAGLIKAVCPGFVKTKLTGFAEGTRTHEQAAKKIVELALLGEKGPTTSFTNEDYSLPC